MTTAATPPGGQPAQGAADKLLARSAAELLAAPHDSPVPRAVLGLRLLLLAVETHAGHGASPDSGERVAEAIQAATIAVSNAVAGVIERERVWIGMAAAAAVARLLGRRFDSVNSETAAAILDRIDHAALLAADLDSLLRRQRMAARGYPFVRQIARSQAAGANLL